MLYVKQKAPQRKALMRFPMHKQESASQGAVDTPVRPPKSDALSTFRLRALIIGVLLIPIDNYWVIQMEKVRDGPYPTTISIFANAIFVLVVLVAINALARRLFPRYALSQAELLAVYTMVCIGAALAGHDMMPIIVQATAAPYHFATPENHWIPLFGRYLPKWLVVSDPEVLKGFYAGHSSLYLRSNLVAWLAPTIWWVSFVIALIFVMMCINVLVRRQWIERERLTFPVIQLPMAMTEPGAELWRNKVMWYGLAIAGGIDLVNGLHFLYPSIPELVVRDVDLRPLITASPWTAIDWMPRSLFPFVIGLGFLLPADLLFSCWFFYLFWKAQMVLSRAMAWDAIPQFPFVKQQAFGGYAAVLLMLAWTSRGYMKQVWRRIVGRQSDLDDAGEAMSYRSAALGAVVGVAILTWFFFEMGLSPLLGVAAFVIYFALSTVIARMRAELGPPVHDLHFSGPDELITQAVGTRNISPQNLTALTHFYWFNRAYRGHPMAFGIEEMKMAQVTRSSQRKFLIAVMIATVVGALATFWAYLHLSYTLGCGTANWRMGSWPLEQFGRLATWLQAPSSPNYQANLAALFGFALFLAGMRLRFLGWPFHPIGFAISGSWSMNLVWMPLLVAWLAKVMILRYGGLRLYKQAVPFFLGLILGQMIVGSFWSLLGIILHIPTYSFWGA